MMLIPITNKAMLHFIKIDLANTSGSKLLNTINADNNGLCA